MADIPDRIRSKKREWPDGIERICSGALVHFSHSRSGYSHMTVHETPWEVHQLMKKAQPEDMLELHHHGDIAVPVYVRNEEIISIDARWDKVETENP